MGAVIVLFPKGIRQVPDKGYLIGYAKNDTVTEPLLSTTTLPEAITAFVQLLDSKDEKGQLIVTKEKRKTLRFLQRKGDQFVSVLSANGTLKI